MQELCARLASIEARQIQIEELLQRLVQALAQESDREEGEGDTPKITLDGELNRPDRKPWETL